MNKIFNDFPEVADLFCESDLFFPVNNSNGRTFQLNSFLGSLFSLSPIDTEPSILGSNISTKTPDDNKKAGLELTKQFSQSYIAEVSKFLLSLLRATEKSKRLTFKWFCDVISVNIDRKKTYFNPITVSKIGFLMNISYVLIKVLYESKLLVEGNLFNFVGEIDPLFALTSFINFSSFEKISAETYNELLESKKNVIQSMNFNLETKFFFVINTIFSLTIRTVESEYLNLKKKFNEFIEMNATNDPLFKECVCTLKAYEAYLKNNEFCKYMLKFTDINISLFFVLNNSKYTQEFLKTKKVLDSSIMDDLTNYFEHSENKNLSILPLLLVQNVSNVFICLRIISPQVLISDMFSVKQFAYFSIIYSSNPNFITTSHFLCFIRKRSRRDLLDVTR